MNVFSNLSNAIKACGRKVSQLTSFISTQESSFSTSMDEQKSKKMLNDSTMISQMEVLSQQSQVQSQKISQCQTSRRIFRIIGFKDNLQKVSEKSHPKKYYLNNIDQTHDLSYLEWEQKIQCNRKRVYQVEDCEQFRRRILKKRINNNCIAQNRDISLSELYSEMAIQTLNSTLQQEADDLNSIFQFSITKRLKPIQDRLSSGKQIYSADLPWFNDYQSNYSLEYLQRMSYEQITRVPNVKLQNQNGIVDFLQPINLLRKDIPKCLNIGEAFFQITDPQWKNCKMIVKMWNFGNSENVFSLSQVQRVALKIANKSNMRIQYYDEQSGELCLVSTRSS